MKDVRVVLVGRPFSLSRERVREARDGVCWNRVLSKVEWSDSSYKDRDKFSTLSNFLDIDSNCIVFLLT
jgi:hypothetical protein